MGYQALYRLWRPQQFHDVVGQKHITQTLQNALVEKTYAHAYLFTGPRGTGKTSTAKILAKAVNCEDTQSAEPCNQCAACIGITNGSNVDVLEIDAASNNGVDEIRDIRDKVRYAPTEVKKKVYIIDEVHMLTPGAFNALLKTLEEPPEHVLFILATTEPHKIPLTIVSRCQRFDFRRISRQDISARLQWVCEQENIAIDQDALQLLAQKAEGGLRDALSLLDQAASFAKNKVTLEDLLIITGAVAHESLVQLLRSMLSGDIHRAITLIDELLDQGKDASRLMEDLIYYLRDLLLIQKVADQEELLQRATHDELFRELANEYTANSLLHAIQKLTHIQKEMKWTHHPRVFLEIACLQLLEQPSAQPSEAFHSQEMSPQPAQSTSLEDQELLQQLKQEVRQLQEQLQQLRQSVQSGQQLQERAVSDSEKTYAKPVNLSMERWMEVLSTAKKGELIKLTEAWPQIVEGVRKKDVVLKALLSDAELAACGDSFFVLAFQNDFHRNEIEKPLKRKLLEEVLNQQLTGQRQMFTLLAEDWHKVKEAFIRQQREQKQDQDQQNDIEEAHALSEQEEHEQQGSTAYTEAVKLFGEEHVELISNQDK